MLQQQTVSIIQRVITGCLALGLHCASAEGQGRGGAFAVRAGRTVTISRPEAHEFSSGVVGGREPGVGCPPG